MKMPVAAALLAAAGLAAPPHATAQQAAAPSFAPPNLTHAGVRDMAASCATCHGTNGRPAAGSVLPALAGRTKEDLVRALSEFRGGQKSATVMHQIAKGYSEDEIAAIAEYFSRQAR